jgi:hypothetical protein
MITHFFEKMPHLVAHVADHHLLTHSPIESAIVYDVDTCIWSTVVCDVDTCTVVCDVNTCVLFIIEQFIV